MKLLNSVGDHFWQCYNGPTLLLSVFPSNFIVSGIKSSRFSFTFKSNPIFYFVYMFFFDGL